MSTTPHNTGKPEYCIKAKTTTPNSHDNTYIWPYTVDLENIIKALGSSVATIRVEIPAELKQEHEGMIIVTASDDDSLSRFTEVATMKNDKEDDSR